MYKRHQLTDFYKIGKVDEDEFEKVIGDADTLAGMLLEIKGEFPACLLYTSRCV